MLESIVPRTDYYSTALPWTHPSAARLTNFRPLIRHAAPRLFISRVAISLRLLAWPA